MEKLPITYKFLNCQEYKMVLSSMQFFTENRHKDTLDEIWFLEHHKVFTLGKASLLKHVLNSKKIPIVNSDRGGQVTYHGPGQLIVYFLIDLIRRTLSVKTLIEILQQSIIDLLRYNYNIDADLKEGLPGVYVLGKKICSIGLKITKGFSYHGLSFNVNMDLGPFKYIDPCGDPNLEITQLKDLINDPFLTIQSVTKQLKDVLNDKFTSYGIK